MEYAWTWENAPEDARRNRLSRAPHNAKRTATRGELRRERQRVQRELPARDPMLELLVDSMTTIDCKVLTDTGTVCAATISNWQTGKTRTPRIDTLRRVADALGKIIVLMDATK
jgi:hypothetical protein